MSDASPSDPERPQATPAARSATGSGAARAGFVCGALSVAVALVAALFASGRIPGRTSGEALLLLGFIVPPLALASLGLSLGGRRPGALKALGIALALVALLGVGLAALIVYLSWSRCAPHCL